LQSQPIASLAYGQPSPRTGQQMASLDNGQLRSCYYYYYYLFTAIGFAPGGSGPYTTQLQQKTYNINNKKHT
jgi:hypothetical protein